MRMRQYWPEKSTSQSSTVRISDGLKSRPFAPPARGQVAETAIDREQLMAKLEQSQSSWAQRLKDEVLA